MERQQSDWRTSGLDNPQSDRRKIGHVVAVKCCDVQCCTIQTIVEILANYLLHYKRRQSRIVIAELKEVYTARNMHFFLSILRHT